MQTPAAAHDAAILRHEQLGVHHLCRGMWHRGGGRGFVLVVSTLRVASCLRFFGRLDRLW